MEQTKGYIRDKHSNAVLSVDDAGLRNYRAERTRITEQLRVAEEVKDLKSDLSEIKDLLARLITRK